MERILLGRTENHRGHTLLPYGRGSKPVIVDCGAHKGEFAWSITADREAVCYSIEANPHLFQQLRLPPNARAFNFAVSGADGWADFRISSNPEASRLTEGDNAAGSAVSVRSTTLDSFFSEEGVGDVDVLKLDIEGAEVEVLASLSKNRLNRIAQISVEYHDFCGFVSPAAVDRSVERLRNSGFDYFRFSYSTRGDVLFVNRRYCRIGAAKKLELLTRHRAQLAIKKAARKFLAT